MISGIKVYSLDRYIEKLKFDESTKITRFRRFYGKCHNDFKPKKKKLEDDESFRLRVDKEYTYKQGKFVLTRDLDYNNKRFKCVFTVFYVVGSARILYGHLSWHNYNPELDRFLLSLEISNYLFYTDEINIESIRLQFLESFNLVHNNYERIEICLDTNYDVIKMFNRMFVNTQKYFFKSFGKRDKIVHDYGNRNRNIKTGDGHKFVSSTYRESFKIYNKTMEIQNNSGKYYILNYLESRGIDISLPIFRMEISISSHSFKKRDYVYLCHSHFTDQNDLRRIMNLYIRMCLDFRKINSQKNVSRYKKSRLI